ncbi:hypothetical protein GCM10010232_66050 [Streptomyces amakusaensis]|uniref:Uncharacterized protein n=1 Tax=Streptomyces amakusaensis TaxID=67271 RepID=A0ABW0AVU3_9ACTN
MTATLRQTAKTIATSAIECGGMASMLTGGAIGAYLGHHLTPTWSHEPRILLAGATAVIGAITTDTLTELALAPLRRLLRTRAPLSSTRPSAPVPAVTLDEALAQVVTATENDAAHRAATAAFRIDESAGFLQDENRWRGYEDGEASFYLAPGVVLHHRGEQGTYVREHRFTLLTGDSEEPVTITGIEEIRHHLAARTAGLPAVPAAGSELLDDDPTFTPTVAV